MNFVDFEARLLGNLTSGYLVKTIFYYSKRPDYIIVPSTDVKEIRIEDGFVEIVNNGNKSHEVHAMYSTK